MIKKLVIALIATSTLASSTFADDDDQEIQDKLDEINAKLDEIQDALGTEQEFPQLPARSDWHTWKTLEVRSLAPRAILVHHMTEAEYQRRKAAHELTLADVNRHDRGE
jgi:hypothetical protein